MCTIRVQHIQSALGGRRFKHISSDRCKHISPSLTQLSERTDLSTKLSVLWVVALRSGYCWGALCVDFVRISTICAKGMMSATGQVCTVLGRDMAPTAAILQLAVPPASAVSEGIIATPAAVVVPSGSPNTEVIEIMSETEIQPQLWGTSVDAPIDLCTSESEESPVLDPTAVIDLTGDGEEETEQAVQQRPLQLPGHVQPVKLEPSQPSPGMQP